MPSAWNTLTRGLGDFPCHNHDTRRPLLDRAGLGKGAWHSLAPGSSLKKGSWGRCGSGVGDSGATGWPLREPLSGVSGGSRRFQIFV